jgi:hypothetical protein
VRQPEIPMLVRRPPHFYPFLAPSSVVRVEVEVLHKTAHPKVEEEVLV